MLKNLKNELYDLLVLEKIRELIIGKSYALFGVDNLVEVDIVVDKHIQIKVVDENGEVHNKEFSKSGELVDWLATDSNSKVHVLEFILKYKFK